MKPQQLWAVVPAAGVGARMQADRPKQYLTIAGKPIVQYTLESLLALSELVSIMLVLHQDDQHWSSLGLSDTRIVTVAGGDERMHSVLKGLDALTDKAAADDWVVVHDAARPAITKSLLEKLLLEVAHHKAGGLLAVPVTDTIKQVACGVVEKTLPRELLWQAQTPQVFRYGLLKAALTEAVAKGVRVTDEAHAMELQGWQPKIIAGDPANIKVTSWADFSVIKHNLLGVADE